MENGSYLDIYVPPLSMFSCDQLGLNSGHLHTRRQCSPAFECKNLHIFRECEYGDVGEGGVQLLQTDAEWSVGVMGRGGHWF